MNRIIIGYWIATGKLRGEYVRDFLAWTDNNPKLCLEYTKYSRQPEDYVSDLSLAELILIHTEFYSHSCEIIPCGYLQESYLRMLAITCYFSVEEQSEIYSLMYINAMEEA